MTISRETIVARLRELVLVMVIGAINAAVAYWQNPTTAIQGSIKRSEARTAANVDTATGNVSKDVAAKVLPEVKAIADKPAVAAPTPIVVNPPAAPPPELLAAIASIQDRLTSIEQKLERPTPRIVRPQPKGAP